MTNKIRLSTNYPNANTYSGIIINNQLYYTNKEKQRALSYTESIQKREIKKKKEWNSKKV